MVHVQSLFDAVGGYTVPNAAVSVVLKDVLGNA